MARANHHAGRPVVCVLLLLLLVLPLHAQISDYVIGPRDVLLITVWGQADLSAKYRVDADGAFVFPLIGAVKAEGQTVRQVEAELRDRLTKGFLEDPQVSVAVDDFRSRRIFVVGQVRQPGSIAMSGEMTLIEVLAHAGSTTADAAPEVLIVHAAKEASKSTTPTLPNQTAASNVTRVNLDDLQTGNSTLDVQLADGDTIFVPRAETVFVSGQVRNPGAYPIGRVTTVLQAITLAGGLTDDGATNRIKVIRLTKGQREELKARLADVLQAGDTVVVPERFF